MGVPRTWARLNIDSSSIFFLNRKRPADDKQRDNIGSHLHVG